jgi:hypothetical protein
MQRQLPKKNNLEIEYIRNNNFRKEDRIQQILKKRGTHPGLVHIFSALEMSTSFKPWYNKEKKKAYLLHSDGKCIHYYFYFIDEELGLCYIRVPTWLPCRLQFYFNGHQWLASQLRRKNIPFTLKDNAFLDIDDFDRAQKLVGRIDVTKLHRKLDRLAEIYCPIASTLNAAYHWSAMQVEYATPTLSSNARKISNRFMSTRSKP